MSGRERYRYDTKIHIPDKFTKLTGHPTVGWKGENPS